MDISENGAKSENKDLDKSPAQDVPKEASCHVEEPPDGEYMDFENNVLACSSILEQETTLSLHTDDNTIEKPVWQRKRGRPRKRGIEHYFCMSKCNLSMNNYVISSFMVHFYKLSYTFNISL